MVICPVEVNEKSSQTIVIGRRGTYNTQEIVFDIGYLIDAYGVGTAVLAVKRSQDSSAYPAVVAQEDSTVTWTVSETDTYYKGAGECELMWYVDGGLAKTIIYPMVVMRDILSTSEEAPDAYQEWVDDLTALGAETLENAQNAAQSASDAESAKDDAIAAKEVAEEAAEIAQEAVVHAPIIQNGYWYIWSDGQYADTGVRAEGQKGDKGDTGEKGDTGNGIASITKTGTAGLVDTYTVTYTDGTTTTFTVTNGEKGDKGDTGATGNGIASIAKTGTSGNVDTYTITYTNGQTTTFTVTNGAVASVAGKTGAVTLDAGDVSFDGTQTYQAGTVGAELSNQKNAISVYDTLFESDFLNWVKGYYSISNGSFTSGSTNWMAVDFVDDSIRLIRSTKDILMYVQAFNKSDASYVGTWNGTAFTTTYIAGTGLMIVDLDKFRVDYPNYKYRISVTAGSRSLSTSVDGKTLVPFKNVVSDIYNYIDDEIYAEKTTSWTKGVINAINSGITTNDNGATSQILYADELFFASGCKAAIRLFKDSTYLGKLNTLPSGIDKAAGNWRFFTGSVNTYEILKQFNANLLQFSLIPTDGTSITSTTVTSYGNAHVILYEARYAKKDEIIYEGLRFSVTKSLRLCISSFLAYLAS